MLQHTREWFSKLPKRKLLLGGLAILILILLILKPIYQTWRDTSPPPFKYSRYLLPGNGLEHVTVLSFEYPTELPRYLDDTEQVLHIELLDGLPLVNTVPVTYTCAHMPRPTFPLTQTTAEAQVFRLILWSPSHFVTFQPVNGKDAAPLSYAMITLYSSYSHPSVAEPSTIYLRYNNLAEATPNTSENVLCFAVLDAYGNPVRVEAEKDSSFPLTIVDNSLPISIQSKGRSFLFRLLDYLFRDSTTGCLTIPALLGIAPVLFSIWKEEQARRHEEYYRNLADRIHSFFVNDASTNSTLSWSELWALFQETKRHPELQNSLVDYVHREIKQGYPAWLYEARQWLSKELSHMQNISDLIGGMKQLNIVPEEFANAWENWQKQFINLSTQDLEHLAKDALVIAKGLGLESISRLTDSWQHLSTQQREEISRYWRHNTLGRYLISSLDRKLLLQNPQGILKPLPAPRGPCRLWPKESFFSEENPFGPLKAEEDSRLIDNSLFWTPPFWDVIDRKQHNLYLFPKGGGLSASLLRACYESGPYGPKGLTVFAATLSLEQAITDESKWLSVLHQAIASSILCTLVADPIWLLLIDDRQAQREIVALLSQAPQTGGLTGLIEALRLRGLSFDDRSDNSTSSEAGQLLMELIASIHSTGLPAVSWDLLYSAVSNIQRYLPWYKVHQDDQDTSKPQGTHNHQNSQEGQEKPEHQPVPFFFWIELSPTMSLNDIHHLWQDRHLRNLGFVKLFLQSSLEPEKRRFLLQLVPESIYIQWDKETLERMLQHRMNQVGIDYDDDNDDDDNNYEPSFCEWLEDHGYTLGHEGKNGIHTPQALIEKGNLWWNSKRGGNGGDI